MEQDTVHPLGKLQKNFKSNNIPLIPVQDVARLLQKEHLLEYGSAKDVKQYLPVEHGNLLIYKLISTSVSVNAKITMNRLKKVKQQLAKSEKITQKVQQKLKKQLKKKQRKGKKQK